MTSLNGFIGIVLLLFSTGALVGIASISGLLPDPKNPSPLVGIPIAIFGTLLFSSIVMILADDDSEETKTAK